MECPSKELSQQLDDFPPIFCHTEISQEQLTGPMLEYAQKHKKLTKPSKQIVSQKTAEQKLFTSVQLLQLISFGLRVVNITTVLWVGNQDLAAIKRDIPLGCFMIYCPSTLLSTSTQSSMLSKIFSSTCWSCVKSLSPTATRLRQCFTSLLGAWIMF